MKNRLLLSLTTLLISLKLSHYTQAENFDQPPYRPTITNKKEVKNYTLLLPLIQNKPAEALKFLKEKTKSKTRSAAFDYLEAIIHLQNDKTKLAIPLLEKAIEKFPPFLSAHDTLFKLYWQENQKIKARQSLLRLIALGHGNAKRWNILADFYSQEKDFANAETAYKQARLFDPTNKATIQNLAYNYLEQEQYERAISLFKKMILAEPKNKNHRLSLINCYLELKRDHKAIEELEIASRLKLLNNRQKLMLANLYYEHEHTEIASAIYLKLAQDKKLETELLVRAITALLNENKITEVETLISQIDLKKVKAQSLEKIYLIQGQLYAEKQNFPKALKAYQACLEKNSLNPYALLGTARLYQEQNQPIKAQSFFKRAIENPQTKQQALLGLTASLSSEKKYTEALQALEKLLEISQNPQYIKYYNDLKAYSAQH